MSRERRRKPFARLVWNRHEEQLPTPASLQLHTEVYPAGIQGASSFEGQLIEGDNLHVMAALLREWEGQIDLIYTDPPFLTGKAYAARIGRGEDSRRPSEWRMVKGYQDTWQDGSEYLDMLFPRLQLMYQLLAPTGTLYLHLDWHASAYARVLLDEIFGPDKLLNEIVWVYHGPSPIRTAFKRKHDTILVYTKSKRYTFNADAVRVAYDPTTVKTFASSPKAGFGKVPNLARGKVPEDWWYFPVVARLHKERTGYPTQKPEALLERVILASSNPGEIVADFFSGSGTAAVVAARLGRRWMACDNSALAIQTTYRRLLLEQAAKPFTVWGLDLDHGPPSLEPRIAVKKSGPHVTITLEDLQPTTNPFPENVNLWEIDWNYDGKIYRSCSQAIREWREDHIILELERNFDRSGPYDLYVRAYDAQGHWGTKTHRISVSID